MVKHVIPAFDYHSKKSTLSILDICFGIGYNSLATLYYLEKYCKNTKIKIYSPEFDKELIHSLKDFPYPKEFEPYKKIIEKISKDYFYEDDNVRIEIFPADAREYLIKLAQREITIDIVYQDAFSSDVNPMLWTKEYFCDVSKLLSYDAIITTYSIATPVRLSMSENRLNIYEIVQNNTNKSTIALVKKDLENRYKYIDMELKKERNPNAKALQDKE